MIHMRNHRQDLKIIPRNQSGSSIMVILMVVGILAIASGAVLTRFRVLQQTASSIGYPEALRQVRDSVKATLDNDGAWFQTVGNNPNTLCLRDRSPNPQDTCTNASFGTLTVRLADNSIFIMDNNPNRGFDLQGQPCNQFGNAGNTTCVFRYIVSWRCQGGVCPQTEFKPGALVASRPVIEVSATLQISPTVSAVFERYKLDAYSFTITRGQEEGTISKFCSSLPGGNYTQSTKDCTSTFTHPNGFDCEALAGPYYWFAGYDSAGQPICVPDVKLGKACSEGSGIVGYNARGEFLCGTY